MDYNTILFCFVAKLLRLRQAISSFICFFCTPLTYSYHHGVSFVLNMFLLSDTTTYSRLTLLFLFPKPGISHFFKELCLFLLEPKIWLLNVVIDIEVSLILDSHSGQNQKIYARAFTLGDKDTERQRQIYQINRNEKMKKRIRRSF